MYGEPPARAWWPAVGAPLERGVRHQCALVTNKGVFGPERFCFPLRATARAVAVLRVCGAGPGWSGALCALRGRPLHWVSESRSADNAEAPPVLSLYSVQSMCPAAEILDAYERAGFSRCLLQEFQPILFSCAHARCKLPMSPDFLAMRLAYRG
jgi:hypothetical protein